MTFRSFPRFAGLLGIAASAGAQQPAASRTAAQPPTIRVALAYRVAVDGQPKPNFSPKGTQVALTTVKGSRPGPTLTVKTGTIKIGPTERSWIPVMLVAEPAHPSDLTVLYIDHNRNGNFSDDGDPYVGTPTQNAKTHAWWTSINKVELPILYPPDHTEPYLVNFWIVREDSAPAPDVLRYSAASWRFGTTRINGIDALVAAMDDNDAVYTKDDMWSVVTASDSNAQAALLSIAEARPMNRLMFVGGEAEQTLEFRSISPDGRWLELAIINKGITKAADRRPDDLVREERSRPRTTKAVAWAHGSQGLSAALASAKKSGRSVLLDFEATWCGPCHTMDQWIWNDAEVAAELNAHYLGVKIDVDLEKSLVKRFNTTGYPTMIILDSQGKEIRRAADYLSSKEMLAMLRAEK